MCGVDGNSYVITQIPICMNPSQITSYCSSEKTAAIKQCSTGCSEGECNTLIMAPDYTDDSNIFFIRDVSGTANGQNTAEVIIDWRVNNVSIAAVNMPFETVAEGIPAINSWTHVAITSQGKVYQNGVYDGNIIVKPIGGIMSIGDRDQTSFDYNGYLDELNIYNRILSAEQIQLLAKANEKVLANQETIPGESWSAAVTANNKMRDGIMKESPAVVIT